MDQILTAAHVCIAEQSPAVLDIAQLTKRRSRTLPDCAVVFVSAAFVVVVVVAVVVVEDVVDVTTEGVVVLACRVVVNGNDGS